MLDNKVVAHRKTGGLEKGTTRDFGPNKAEFHIELAGGGTSTITVEDCKAVFFVKDLEGNPEHDEHYDDVIPGGGKKVEVTFKDGEVIIGFTSGYSPHRKGWFLVPADKTSNNLRIFVVSTAVENVRVVA